MIAILYLVLVLCGLQVDSSDQGQCISEWGACEAHSTEAEAHVAGQAMVSELGQMLDSLKGVTDRAEADAAELRKMKEGMALLREQVDKQNELTAKKLERKRLDSSQPLPSKPQMIAKDPLIWVIDNFLTARECDHIASLPQADDWQESKVTDPVSAPEQDIKVVMAEQRSYQTFDVPETRDDAAELKDELVKDVLDRMHNQVNLPLDYGLGEAFQITRFQPKGRYHLHPDSSIEIGRHATVFVFLTDVQGGEELFPFAKPTVGKDTQLANEELWSNYKNEGLGEALEELCRSSRKLLRVAPKKGRAIIWWNHYPDLQPNDRSIHASCPVKNGTKIVSNRWIRWYEPSSGNLLHTLIQKMQGV